MEPSEIILNDDTILARNAEIVVRQSGGETIALNASRGLFFTLNETAWFILNKLDGYASLAAVRDALTEEFEVDAAMAGEAVTAIARDFLEKGFAHLIEPA
jgi:hypothetical protein